MISSNALRQRFLAYFSERQHTVLPSSSLIPGNDPSLLFTNSGMVQFKNVFLGSEKRPYTRATTAQRSLRAGGKHNDLDNVGYTARHHTFFEMLGNFSFGDYFKEEAITYAWEFLTKELGIPKERLWVTVYKDDDEAADIWIKKIGVDPNRISRCDEDNFWSMGDTGPCGPCSEIFYDHGPEIAGGPPGSPDADGDRYIEIWNLVFMQYNRDAAGKLTPLPKPSVDTGMGLERMSAVLQGVHNNYDTDAFTYLIDAIAQLGKLSDKHSASIRVVADHIRSCTFLIVDGVLPSNEGRGYVLRRIIRRAIRHGNKLGFRDPFFYQLVAPLVKQMKAAYPELEKLQSHCERVLQQEEIQFAKTLEQGLKIFEEAVSKLKDNTLPGELLFRLYDTYGFPVDLTADIARERGLIVDQAGFERAMQAQRDLSAAASKFSDMSAACFNVNSKTEFVGYNFIETDAKVLALFDDSAQPVTRLADRGWVVLDKTPFYAESGGQVSDVGSLIYAGGRFHVEASRKENEAILHYGHVEGQALLTETRVDAQVENQKRRDTACNHSATHLLHAALKQVLGDHTQQKGSLVEPTRLRFDYAHYEAPTAAQLHEIESLVNHWIRSNVPVETRVMSPEEAIKQGAQALFGEKYGENVRVLQMGDYSMELCGGTHVSRTGDIGLFKIVSEASISAGIRRIEALTGREALVFIDAQQSIVKQLEDLFKAKQDRLPEKIQLLQNKLKEVEKRYEKLQLKAMSQAVNALCEEAKQASGLSCVLAELEPMDAKLLRQLTEQAKSQLSSGIVVLAAPFEEKHNVMIAITGDLVKKMPSSQIIDKLSAKLNGKGGGRPEFAQFGAQQVSGMTQVLADLKQWLIATLK